MADEKKIPGQKFKNEFSWSEKKKEKKKRKKAIQCDKKQKQKHQIPV